MASTSSSASIPRSCTHHVFLSFRGEDTRTGFTSHLYAALRRKGITTYKDDNNLRKGDVISDELLKAIEESMFAVIVFSPDYASSSWCLDELQKIIECNNKLGIQIEAVFYGVKPCDVRHQIGTFEEAFKKHEQRHDREKVQRWREALTQVAAYSGWSSKNQDEAVLVENIAQHIFEILIPKLPSSMKNLVGIESRVEQVITQIGLGLNDVRYMSIWGMGGIGKTTIARAVFETIRSRFEVTCFLADVREQCEKKDITQVQKQLLDQTNISSNAIYNKYDGRTMIQNSLRLKKVLLVLDDVNHEKQLENLAGEKDWFGPGSRIIITTRDVEVVKEQEVYETYKVEALVESEAFNLFCSKAFKRQKASEGFLDLSKKVVNYSGGLPLALKVLGSYLNGRPIVVWHSAIGKIKKSSHSEIIDVLKISYDGLDSTEKNIFLDIACFFKGRGKDYVTRILKGCGHDAEIGIDILINRSLVTLEQETFGEVTLGMHDLLEEMGKQIVIQESPSDASKRGRLWCYEDVDFVLTHKKENEATHSIVMYREIEENWGDLDRRDLSFSNIWQLKLLILDGMTALILCDIPCTLKVLHWIYCPMKTLPFTDQRYELVEIDLSYSKIVELWDGKKFLKDLKHLNLSGCYKLERTPDLSEVPNLKTLNLEECRELNYIHPSLAHHKSLVELNLRGCSSLETLADKLEMSSLERLNLCSCYRLRRVPEFGDCMKQLSILTLRFTDIKELPSTLGNLVGLSKLDLAALESIVLPVSLGCFVGLKKLDLSGCNELSCVPYSSHGLESLTVWDSSDNSNIVGLLSSLSLLTSLISLKLWVSFPTSKEYDLGHLASLTDLDLSCNSFSRVPISIHQLPRLKCLNLNNCSFLEVLPELPSSLRELRAEDCYSLDASSVNDVISKACCGFVESASKDCEEILQMLIHGKEIPAWFEHQEQDNAVSVSFPHNGTSTETLALALCFQFEDEMFSNEQPSMICNGKEFISKSLLKVSSCICSENLFIVCLNGYYFSNLLSQHNRFQMLFPNIEVQRCGARWVCKQDIQDFKK
ncbi:TMV resistance protein N-like isoform X2 [Arachis stenosperma]|uniref:TMV resistance protein N-like isoform X2 n=1 Tax=Arachis stenosperma TaxID=217475 RepID=UPI0025AD0D97|nr:TMV resistance protein N-like isoform X2 [Arachis stenosperma]